MPTRSKKSLALLCVIVLLAVAYALGWRTSEPFFNNDETRHLMTGVYFRDLLHDLPFGSLREYTVNYYLQHPALGLLVWPPFFYFVEGLMMSVFGTSIVGAKILVGCFGLMACVYLFRLVARTHDETRACLAVLFFGLAPLIFQLSHYVMLEIPTLALSLAAIFHFVGYMEEARRLDLFLAAIFSALAALTRFEAAYLLPLFLILIAWQGSWKILRRGEVWLAATLALLMLAPFYALSASSIGWMQFKFATETLSPSVPGFLSLSRLLYYPKLLPSQLGWFALIPALVGICFSVANKARREKVYVYLALMIVTYLMFTPIGELESRHSIYWLPAFALFAAEGVFALANALRAPQLFLPLAACVLACAMWATLHKPLSVLHGYEAAANYVAANSTNSPYCFFIGGLNGDFIYELRRHDPQRKLWTLRADKLLFSVLVVPGTQHTQLAASDEDTLATIFKYDPEFLVMEDPDTSQPAAFFADEHEERLRNEFERQVREVINRHPERFALEKIVAVTGDEPHYQNMKLKVFRNTFRNENPTRRLEFDVLMLRRSVQTDVP
jgi:hypothetical protein